MKTDFSIVFGKNLSPEFQTQLNKIFSGNIIDSDNSRLVFDNDTITPVVRNIPRFVPGDNYTASFSFQWTNYTTTQLDSSQDSDLTLLELQSKTGLTPDDVKDKLILDAGVGIGRHTEILASWGAYVVGVDLSEAVETARDNLKEYPNAVVLQADIGNLPFKPDQFDHILSMGVLHHTPDTKSFALGLLPFLKPGGQISIWVYSTLFSRRGEWVPIVSKLPMTGFNAWSDWIVEIARDKPNNHWIAAFMRQFPFAIHHPTKERSALALFDGFTPTYHWTHKPEEVAQWFSEAGLKDIKFSRIPTSVSARKPLN